MAKYSAARIELIHIHTYIHLYIHMLHAYITHLNIITFDNGIFKWGLRFKILLVAAVCVPHGTGDGAHI